MALKTYNITFNRVPGSYGTLVEYKLQTDTEWTVPNTPTNPTQKDEFPIELQEGFNYHVRVSAVNPSGECSKRPRIISVIVPSGIGTCCPATYSASPDGTYCYKIETIAPTITESDVCMAISQLAGQYSSSGAKIYDPGYDIHLNGIGLTFTTIMTAYWKEAPAGLIGPMNREGIWVDTDCDGNKDILTLGAELQAGIVISTPVAKTVYVGIAGDNTFELVLNGTTIVNCTNTSGEQANNNASDNFNWWHIIPVDLLSGPNTLNFIAKGDGSTNDAFAAVVYDNTAGQLITATSNGDLNILFKTSDLRGDHIDIATCPATYELDTTGGQGAYICKKITTTATVPC